MSAQEIHLPEGTCSCLLEDPEQGTLRLDVMSLSSQHATLGETPALTIEAYVDVTLEFRRGPRSHLFAQIVTRPRGDADGDDTEPPEHVLRWIHSDPLGEAKLATVVKQYIETGGRFGQEEERPTLPNVNVLPKVGPPGIVVVPDQHAPTSVDPAAGGSMERRSFKFSHLVQGAEGPREIARSRREISIRRPPRGSQENDIADDHDMSSMLRQRAKMVRASDLAARHDQVRVLGESTLRQLLDEAVNEAVENIENSLGEAERKQLLEEAEEAFHERLEAFKAEKADLESQTRVLADQLEKAQALLEEERHRVVSADQFTVSDAGMVEIETRLERMLHRAIKNKGVDAALETEMRNVLSRLLDEERDRISVKAQETQSSNIELLERKIERLAKSLDETTKQRDSAERRAHALEAAGGTGLRNVMTAGIDDDDPNKKRKLGLLKEIFDQNKEMREHLAVQKSTGGSAPATASTDAGGAASVPGTSAGSGGGTSETEETQIIPTTATAVCEASENAEVGKK